jgi:hypothetical protein
LLVFIFSLISGGASQAQNVQFVVSPIPELETFEDANLRAYLSSPPRRPDPIFAPALKPVQPTAAGKRHPFYWLDRTAMVFGIVQGSAELFDGVTTRYFIHHCSNCAEHDPASRLLLGRHPTWGGMIPAGIAEAVVSTYTYKKLSHSPHLWVRSTAPLIPLGLIGVHIIEGARNIPLRNKYYCADPGYVVTGSVCVPAPLETLAGIPTGMPSDPGSHRDQKLRQTAFPPSPR